MTEKYINPRFGSPCSSSPPLSPNGRGCGDYGSTAFGCGDGGRDDAYGDGDGVGFWDGDGCGISYHDYGNGIV
jgi:hypothetical protein